MDLPSPCPCCGSLVLPPADRVSTLFAICDVLTLKALEQLGRYLVRAERSRYHELGARPFTVAHTVWRAPDIMVDKALRNTWDVVPFLVVSHGPQTLDPCDVVQTLDDYVHDLAVAGHEHTLESLGYRFATRLNLPLLEPAWT